MPCFRGIELSVITEADPSALPEFPHPDGSSIRLLATGQGSAPGTMTSRSVSGQTEGEVRMQRANPTISVYIPSIAGMCNCYRDGAS
jgi:hypothetical protein